MIKGTVNLIPATTPMSSRPPVEIVSIPEEESNEPQVSEEEAAVAAMLSLKTGPKKVTHAPQTEDSYGRHEVKISRPTKYRFYRSWEPRPYYCYEYPSRTTRPSEYHGIPPPPPRVQRYRYFHAYDSYERYDYD